MKVSILYLYGLMLLLLLNVGCSHLPQDSSQTGGEYSPKPLESKSILFEPLDKDRILFSDESLASPTEQDSILFSDKPLDLLATEEKTSLLSEQKIPLTLENTLEAQPKSIWQRISDGYSLLPQQDKNKFASTLNAYRKYRRHFSDISKNAAPYLHHIVERIESRGMPLEIALLPAVESGFRPHARSPYRAEGLWQFIPSTGRMFGLKQNRWYDGRRDVMAATDAALDYLESLHKRLDGDWLHALAAYNCGEANVRRAIRKNLAQGKPTDYWSLDLPKETKAYIPKLMAVSEIIGKANDYGITLEDIPNEPYLQKIDVGEQIDLKLAAELADIPFNKLKRLNPGFKQSVMSPTGPFYLVLPTYKVELFRQRLAKTHDKLPNGQPTLSASNDHKTANNDSFKRYRIRQGDSLWTIARRHNTTVKNLCKINGISKRARLRIGNSLRVPNNSKNPRVASQSKTSEKNQAHQASKPQDKTARLVPTAHQAQGVHKIRPGDVLGKIAKRYNTSVKAICKLNGITTKTTLRVGKTLLIPAPKKAQGI